MDSKITAEVSPRNGSFPVQFAGGKTQMWLPQQAEIYLGSAGRRFHHRHLYTEYRIFSVEVGQKIGTPQ